MRRLTDYYLNKSTNSIHELSKFLFNNVFRTSFEKPGFGIIDLGAKSSSKELRGLMVALKNALSLRLEHRNKKKLNYQWMGRFDQQATTKFHIDNAKDQSFLMLGYEPSQIESKLYLADYAQFANDQHLTHNDFFSDHNPIFSDKEAQLSEYITAVEYFPKEHWKLVLINNSNLKSNETYGVMHKAEIIKKDLGKSRIINSTMIYSADGNEIDEFNTLLQQDYIQTKVINK